MAIKKDFFKSKYLAKEDLSNPRVVTIAALVGEILQTDDGQDEKPMIRFQEGEMKPFILNSSNWDVVADGFGHDTATWIGKQIELYVDPSVQFRGRRVGGIRCRIPVEETLEF